MTYLNFHMSRNILSIARMAETVGNQLLTGIMPPDKDGDSYHVPPLVTWSYVVECAYSRQPFTHHMHTYKVMQRNTRQRWRQLSRATTGDLILRSRMCLQQTTIHPSHAHVQSDAEKYQTNIHPSHAHIQGDAEKYRATGSQKSARYFTRYGSDTCKLRRDY